MEAKERKEGRSHIELTINILWQIWKSRNLIQFSNDRTRLGLTVGKAVQEWQEYSEIDNEMEEPKKEGREVAYGEGKYLPPPQDFICLNTDAALRQQDGKIGWRVVARCSSGNVIGPGQEMNSDVVILQWRKLGRSGRL